MDTPALPSPTTPPALPDEAVRLFLSDRDVLCPGCNYNLRGIQDSACPECGKVVELTLSRPGRSRGYLLFVLLALGWVLTAGTMNGLRAWQRIRQEATPLARTMVTFNSFRHSTGTGGTTRSFSNSGPMTVTMNSSGGFTVTTSPAKAAPAGPAWGNVSRDSWFNFGWWSGLGLLSLIAVILAVILRRRFNQDAPPWRLVAAAAVLFALYAGFHAVMFSREFLL